MTNKETAEIIKTAIAEVEWEYPMEYAAAFDRAIEVLEQEPILDKIRAEIGQLPSYAAKFADGASAIHVDKEKVLQIIDKYKEESEGEDAVSN